MSRRLPFADRQICTDPQPRTTGGSSVRVTLRHCPGANEGLASVAWPAAGDPLPVAAAAGPATASGDAAAASTRKPFTALFIVLPSFAELPVSSALTLDTAGGRG